MSSKQAALDVAGEAGLVEVTASANGHQPVDDLSYEERIAGKLVRLKRRVPLRDGRRLPELSKVMQNSGDLYDMLPFACMLIESWEFPGDPHDPAAYEDMDTFTEFNPLMEWLGTQVHQRSEQASPKN